ncbi:zinc finger protein 862-like [Rhizophagus clarus]|uniref:Zinc finger protein 862-like n=2 Tax=Rhizophagus clarus TaxID=94130 RepID=A0A8H3QY08_9GLOM|nr:zinc finger protein 862-like [Rhizophagus clarus]
MLGRNNGVATKLANKNPYLFVSHCIAHQLALACNSTQKQVAFCKYIETLIKEMYHFFSHLMELSKIFQRRYIIFSDINPIINSTIQKIQHEYLEVDDDGNQKLSAHLNNFLLKAPPAKETFISNHHILFESQDEVDLSILSSIKIMNPIEWPKNNKSLNDYEEKELEKLIDFYGVANEPNYPIPIIDADTIHDEWDNFKAIILANYRNLSIDDLLPLLFQYHSDMYPNILGLISIFYSIPFSSIVCERGFSRQNLIKTDICNQLNNDTLHMLMMVGLYNVNLIEFNFDNAL